MEEKRLLLQPKPRARLVRIYRRHVFRSATDVMVAFDREVAHSKALSADKLGADARAGDWLRTVVARAPEWRGEILVCLLWRARMGTPAQRQRALELLRFEFFSPVVVAPLCADLRRGALTGPLRTAALRVLHTASLRSACTIEDPAFLRDLALDPNDGGEAFALWLQSAPEDARSHLGEVLPRCSPEGCDAFFHPFVGDDPRRLVEIARLGRVAPASARVRLVALIRGLLGGWTFAKVRGLRKQVQAAWPEIDV